MSFLVQILEDYAQKARLNAAVDQRRADGTDAGSETLYKFWEALDEETGKAIATQELDKTMVYASVSLDTRTRTVVHHIPHPLMFPSTQPIAAAFAQYVEPHMWVTEAESLSVLDSDPEVRTFNVLLMNSVCGCPRLNNSHFMRRHALENSYPPQRSALLELDYHDRTHLRLERQIGGHSRGRYHST